MRASQTLRYLCGTVVTLAVAVLCYAGLVPTLSAQVVPTGHCCMVYGRACVSAATPADCLNGGGLAFSQNLQICNSGCLAPNTPASSRASSVSTSSRLSAPSTSSTAISSAANATSSAVVSSVELVTSSSLGEPSYYCCDGKQNTCVAVLQSVVREAGGDAVSLPNGCQNVDVVKAGVPAAQFTTQGPYISQTVCSYFCAQVQLVTTPMSSAASVVASRRSSSVSTKSSVASLAASSAASIALTKSSRSSLAPIATTAESSASVLPMSSVWSSSLISSLTMSAETSSSSAQAAPFVTDFYCSRFMGGPSCQIVQFSDPLETGTVFFNWPKSLCTPLCSSIQDLGFCANTTNNHCTVTPVDTCVRSGYVAFSGLAGRAKCEQVLQQFQKNPQS